MTDTPTITKEEAQRRIKELRDAVDEAWEQIEEFAQQHNLTVHGSDPDATAVYYPTRDSFKEAYSFSEEDMEHYDAEYGIDFPGWVSSSMMC